MATVEAGRRALRREDKRRAILDIADRMLMQQGYAATSMSEIAAALGGSKATLWSYFPSKDLLFAALLDAKVGDFADALAEALLPEGGTAAALTRFGRSYLAKVLAEDSRALRRLVGAESNRFPEIALAFFERGPRPVRERLAEYLAGEIAAGRLRQGSPMLAARQFLGLLQAGSFADHVWHRPSAAVVDIAAEVDEAVEAFLRAWAPSP